MDANTDLARLKAQYNYAAATPMMQQYLDIKFQHQECLLLFRMGDFYELFFDDALEASKILGIALAKRGKHAGEELPMCGVPHHSLESYLLKLLDYGAKVAICDQQETPEEAKKRGGYKAVVKREVVRIITPGTVLEDSIIDSTKPNYLAAISIDNQLDSSISFIDLSTSYIATICCPLSELPSQLINLDPKEILISDRWQYNDAVNNALNSYKNRTIYQVDSLFALKKNENTIKSFYNLQSLDSIGSVEGLSLISLGVVLQYIITTQKHNIPTLPLPRILQNKDYMFIDAATRRSLELTSNVHGKYQGSLLSCINHCVTKQGSRLLYQFLSTPLNQIDQINHRLNLTSWFKEHKQITQFIREQLSKLGDLERIISKIATARALPSDLRALADVIMISQEIKAALSHVILQEDIPILLKEIDNKIIDFENIVYLITAAINPEAPNNLTQTGVILTSYHPKIEELSQLLNNSAVIIAELQGKYRLMTGVESLKITKNNVLGYFVEVTAKNAGKVQHEEFTHRQSTQNAVRFSTERLSHLETGITSANAQLQGLEQQIWCDICDQILQYRTDLTTLAHALSELDVFSNFAFIAAEFKYCRPELCDDKNTLNIQEGRHPIVERYLQSAHQDFTANHCTLSDAERIWLLTGPNMAGKSTFLRQNALIIILAQIGCFVPASSAKIAIADKLFSRIGASDDLAQGQSTFMLEMIETSAILNQATDKSFIILDEVGRGTSTYDGMSIAWAILEYLHNKIGCRSLFATHYHELTKLSDQLFQLANYSSSIDDSSGKLVFLHKIIAGSADKSYGLHVAELAGLPDIVVKRAEEILHGLENANESEIYNQLSLPSAAMQIKEKIIYKEKPSPASELLSTINPDNLTPKQALEFLYELKNKL